MRRAWLEFILSAYFLVGAPSAWAADNVDVQRYMVGVQDRVRLFWAPPRGKERQVITVRFMVEKSGVIKSSKIHKSCGSAAYDESALEAVRKASPVRPFPQSMTYPQVEIEFDLAYNPFNTSPARKMAIRLSKEGQDAQLKGNVPLAISKYEESSKADPTYPDSKERLAELYYNNAVIEDKNYEQALYYLHKSLSLSNSDTTYDYYKTVLKGLGKNPQSFSDRVQLGDDAQARGNREGAAWEYSEALKLKADANVEAKLKALSH